MSQTWKQNQQESRNVEDSHPVDFNDWLNRLAAHVVRTPLSETNVLVGSR